MNVSHCSGRAMSITSTQTDLKIMPRIVRKINSVENIVLLLSAVL